MSYTKQNFTDGQTLTAAQLNHIEDGIAASSANTSNTLPAATASTLGGVKVGRGLTVTKDGTLSVTSVNGFSIKAQTTDPGTGSAISAGTILLVYK
nr:MAG TPA: hypothetical protein [Caudoviricetes sp.]